MTIYIELEIKEEKSIKNATEKIETYFEELKNDHRSEKPCTGKKCFRILLVVFFAYCIEMNTSLLQNMIHKLITYCGIAECKSCTRIIFMHIMIPENRRKLGIKDPDEHGLIKLEGASKYVYECKINEGDNPKEKNILRFYNMIQFQFDYLINALKISVVHRVGEIGPRGVNPLCETAYLNLSELFGDDFLTRYLMLEMEYNKESEIELIQLKRKVSGKIPFGKINGVVDIEDLPPCIKKIKTACQVEKRHPKDPERILWISALVSQYHPDTLIEFSKNFEFDQVKTNDTPALQNRLKNLYKTPETVTPVVSCFDMHSPSKRLCAFSDLPFNEATIRCHGKTGLFKPSDFFLNKTE